MSGKPQSVKERFFAKVGLPDENGCMPWLASTRYGYGKFGVRAGLIVAAHRFAYELWVGPIPEGLQLDHTCNNPPCCNPAHLEPVTGAENIRRMVERSTHCRRGVHRWDEQSPVIRPGIGKQCRPCRNERRRALYRERTIADVITA